MKSPMNSLPFRIVTLLLATAFGLATLSFGVLLWHYTLDVGARLGLSGPLVTGGGALLLLLGTVAFHECGHLFAALLLRFRFVSFDFGPLRVVREGESLRVRLNRTEDHALAAVRAMPTGSRCSRPRWTLFVAAGPLANLLAAVLCLALSALANEWPAGDNFPGRPFSPPGSMLLRPRSLTAYWLNIAGLLNVLCLLGTLVPTKSIGLASDGAQLLALLWDPHGSERNLHLMMLGAAMQGGTRPANWDAALVEEMLTHRAGSREDVVANLYGYYHAVDTAQVDRAGELLDLAVAQRNNLPLTSRVAVCLEAAYFEAFYRHNAVLGREWLERAQGGQVEQHTRLRAEAAVLLAEGHSSEAAAKVEAALAVIGTSKDPGGSIAERDLLNAILAEARKGISAATEATGGIIKTC